jgi:hypothetical protein
MTNSEGEPAVTRASAPPEGVRFPSSPARRFAAIIGGLALLKFLILLATARRYGYFIDEFYYLACARHLSWGYVDQPPLSIALLRTWISCFGDSLFSIRVVPAMTGAATVILTGLLARDFGARSFGVLLAGLCVLANPVFWAIDHFYSMNAWETLLWTAALLVLVRILRDGGSRRWLVLGFLLGLGALNKVGTIWLAGGMFAGLLLSTRREDLRTPWPWLGSALALVIFVPHLLWQISHGWPTLEFIRNATRDKYAGITRGDFLGALLFEYNPVTLPVWILGLISLLGFRLRAFRPVAVAWLTVFGILLVNGHSRSHYLSGAIPVLYAAGGAAADAWLERCRARRWLRPAWIVLVAVGGFAFLPLFVPVLSVDNYLAYGRALGFSPKSAESDSLAGMPQTVADQIGWNELVDAVALACDRLPPEEKGHACILAGFYGAAGAIEQLGRGRGLPPVVCGHNSYWYWGPGDCDGSVVVAMGIPRADLERGFASVDSLGVVPRTRGMPYRNGMHVWICREPLAPLGENWSRTRHFD